MTSVDFLRLISLADRREYAPGERVIGLGDRHHHMHLVKVSKPQAHTRHRQASPPPPQY